MSLFKPGAEGKDRLNIFVKAISTTEFIRTFGRSAAWVIIPLYLADIRHISFIVIGLLFFLTSVISLPFSLYGGRIIDRIGRRRVVLVLPPIVFTLFLSLTFAIQFSSPTIVVETIYLFIAPFGSVQAIADNVIITDTTTITGRIEAFSIIRIAGNVGFAFGPAIGGFLAGISYALVFLAPAIASILEWFVYIFVVKETKAAIDKDSVILRKIRFPWNDKIFMGWSLLIAASFFAVGQWGPTLTLFLSTDYLFTAYQIGVMYAINGIVVAIFQLPVNRLVSKLSEPNRISLGLIFYAVTFLLISFSSNFYFILIDIAFLTIGENISTPPITSSIGKMAPSDKRGQYYGVFQVFSSTLSPLAIVFGTSILPFFLKMPVIFWGIIFAINISVAFFIFFYGTGNRLKQRLAGEDSLPMQPAS
ncbi:MFS transporter [Oxyplasma meridianum]|uniref:MFS transporter n=1 Tax=Oxyplasma meridianum TaxID=3073602 RepID=A0AAX4NFD0_9ARCH